MKIKLFEQRIKGHPSDEAQNNIYYKISLEGCPDATVGLLQYNYCGDYDFTAAVDSYNSKPNGSNCLPKKFKPTLTKKDFEDCAKILKFWKSKDIFVPGANCSSGYCHFGNIHFTKLEVEHLKIYRMIEVPIERYISKYCSHTKDDEDNVTPFLDGMKLRFDKLLEQVLVTIYEEIPQEQVRLILFVNNWINLQEKRFAVKEKKERIREFESRIKKAEDAMAGFLSIEEMQAYLQNILKGNRE